MQLAKDTKMTAVRVCLQELVRLTFDEKAEKASRIIQEAGSNPKSVDWKQGSLEFEQFQTALKSLKSIEIYLANVPEDDEKFDGMGIHEIWRLEEKLYFHQPEMGAIGKILTIEEVENLLTQLDRFSIDVVGIVGGDVVFRKGIN
jgi:hypothetical protein